MFQEYWVDFLGGLLPGTLFFAAFVIAVAPVFVLYVSILSLDFEITYISFLADVLDATENTPNVIWLAIATAIIALSYVLGHLFYRQDPNIPNQRSFLLLKSNAIDELENKLGRKIDAGSKELMTHLKREYACTSEEDCQFPFPYFDEYLEQRGMDHLTQFVLWKSQPKHRTKNWINILKIRLKLHFPNRCSTIVRNEAHVRLASSTWYVGQAVRRCSILALLGLALSVPIFLVVGGAMNFFESVTLHLDRFSNTFVNYVFSLTSSIATYYMGVAACTRIERFLHYQRQREVVHVLETSWSAFYKHPELLNPPFQEYGNWASTHQTVESQGPD